MKKVFEKIIEKLEEEKMSYFLTIANTGDEKLDCTYEQVGDALDKAIEIVKQEAEKFGRDTNVWSKRNNVLEFANLLKELCCKKDEDYDNPVISPKYLNDTIENLLLDFNEKYNNGWIPCSERLPKYGEVVMCSCTNSGITISCITHKGVKPSKSVRFGQHSVIAWQPLPKPFQKGDNNENS